MEIVVQRIQGYKDHTLGIMHIDGELVSFTLEDEEREVKVMGETRIPAGRYEVKLRKVGGIHERYKKKYSWHKGTLWLQDVPGFQYILIHIGNTDEDTAGCILVGDTCNVGKNLISSSTISYERICCKYVYPAFDRSESVWIVIKD